MPVQTSSLPGQAAMRCIDFGLVLMENESVREPPKATGLVCNALKSPGCVLVQDRLWRVGYLGSRIQ